MSDSIPRLPSTTRVLRTQTRLLAAPRSTVFLALLLLAAYAVAAAGIVSFEVTGAPSVFRCYPLLLIAGACWAVSVWGDAGSPQRDYFWALPVNRSAHALARTVAGAALLVAGLIVLALLGVGIDSLSTGEPGTASALAWVSLFSGPLTLYLVVCAIALVSAYPGRWAIGVVIGWTLLRQACAGGVTCGPTVGGRSVITELLGLVPAVMDVLRGEFVAQQAVSPALAALMAAWLLAGLGAVMLAARRLPAI